MSTAQKYSTVTARSLGLEGVNFKGFELDDIFSPGANLKDMPITTWELLQFHIQHAILVFLHNTIDFWYQIRGDVNHAATSVLLMVRTWTLWIVALAPARPHRVNSTVTSGVRSRPGSIKLRRYGSGSSSTSSDSSDSSTTTNHPSWTHQLRTWISGWVVSLSRRLPWASRHLSWLYASASSDLGAHLGLLEQQKSPLLIKREVAKLGTVPKNVGFVLELQPLLEGPPELSLPKPLHLATGEVLYPSQDEVDQAQGEIDAYRVKMAVHNDREQARIKQSIANIVVWCSVVGIKRVTIYEDSGALVRDHDSLWEIIQRQLKAYYGCSATNCGSRPDFVAIHSPGISLSNRYDNDSGKQHPLAPKGGSDSAPPPLATSTPLGSPKNEAMATLSAPPESVEMWGVDLTLISGTDGMSKAAQVSNLWLSQTTTSPPVVDVDAVHQSLLELTRGPIELLYVATKPYCSVRRFPQSSISDSVLVYDNPRCTMSEYVTGSLPADSVVRRSLQNVFGPPSRNQDEGGMLFEFFYRGLETYARALSSEFRSMDRRRLSRSQRKRQQRKKEREKEKKEGGSMRGSIRGSLGRNRKEKEGEKAGSEETRSLRGSIRGSLSRKGKEKEV